MEIRRKDFIFPMWVHQFGVKVQVLKLVTLLINIILSLPHHQLNNQTTYIIKVQRLKNGTWAIYMDPFVAGMTTAQTICYNYNHVVPQEVVSVPIIILTWKPPPQRMPVFSGTTLTCTQEYCNLLLLVQTVSVLIILRQARFTPGKQT